MSIQTSLARSAVKSMFPPIMAAAPAPGVDPSVAVDTRFGRIEFDRNQAITFPKGIPGFKEYQEFGLTLLPNNPDSGMLLLQSLQPTDLSFIVLAYDADGGHIESADIDAARTHLGIAPDDLAIMLIATVHKRTDGFELSVNLRAPLFLDTANRLGWQFIMSSDKYEVRHMLGV